MHHQARSITTSQHEPHEKLGALVEKYQNTPFKRPISEHTREAFECVVEWLSQRQGPIILDSCCGVGESTAKIAEAFPDACVVGLDKSAARLEKHTHYGSQQGNYKVIRADVNDFWRLAKNAGWKLERHFLLYPNPYPKPAQVQKRWYASPAMPDLVALGGILHVRSNWQLYLQEFALALQIYAKSARLMSVPDDQLITTPFERKYLASGQDCWQLVCDQL